MDRIVAPLELSRKLYRKLKRLAKKELLGEVPDVPKSLPRKPQWKKIEEFNRKRYAEKMREEVEELRRDDPPTSP